MNKEKNLLDFQDPGNLSQELLSVPGFVNGLKEYTLKVAPRPNEMLAFAGALAMLAHLSGRSYRDNRGQSTNIYLAALAPSGMGKEEPRVTNKKLATALGILESVPDSVGSGEGLEEAVANSPSLLLQCDEAETLLTAMHGKEGHSTRLNEMILRFFSEAKSAHAVRLLAKDEGVAKTIHRPHLTLLATGIPKFFCAALNEKALLNGLMGRCLFLESDEFNALGKMTPCEIPGEIIRQGKYMAGLERQIVDTGVFNPIIVGETPDAARKIAELFEKCDEIARGLHEQKLSIAEAMYVRMPEKALKLALLWAISENCFKPVITADAVIWGTKFTTHVTAKMLYMSQFFVAEGKFDRLKKRFIGLLASAGGSIDRTTLLRRLAIDASTFQKVVHTLHMCDLIEEETLERRKIVYTLKDA